MLSLFLSYNFRDEAFVERVARHLRTQRPGLDSYFYGNDRGTDGWTQQIGQALSNCSYDLALPPGYRHDRHHRFSITRLSWVA
jgi:hypothetical protein